MTKIINLKEDIDTMEEVPLPGMGGILVSVWAGPGYIDLAGHRKARISVICPGLCWVLWA